MPASVGIDISRDTAVICFLLPDGREPVARWSVANTQPGAESLAKRLAELAQQHQIDGLRLGIESTGLYWWHLACALRESPQLATYHPKVYVLNPTLVKAFRQHFGAMPKTDRADAFLIAERVRFERQVPAPFEVDLRYAPLQRLTRFRMHLAKSLAREKSYFLTFLFLQFSGFGQADVFDDSFGATSCAVLEEFTTEELAQQPLDQLASYLMAKGRGHFKDPERLAETLQRAARDSYRLTRCLDEPLRLILSTTLTTIRTLSAQRKAIDQTITKELATIPQTLLTVPGLGPVWTAGLVAEIGDIRRFADDGALAQYAGLTWQTYESGRFQAEDTPLTKHGNAYLRYYLVEAATSVRLHCGESTTSYQEKVAQSTKHAQKRALVLTARKLVRLVDALLRSDTVYRPPEYRQDRKERSLPTTQRPRPHRHHRRATATS